jgi:hypothetical protein
MLPHADAGHDQDYRRQHEARGQWSRSQSRKRQWCQPGSVTPSDTCQHGGFERHGRLCPAEPVKQFVLLTLCPLLLTATLAIAEVGEQPLAFPTSQLVGTRQQMLVVAVESHRFPL